METNNLAKKVTIIKPTTGWIRIDFKELWRFRGLFYVFTWRDIKVRYKQTALGVIWAVLQPFVMMVIFSAFFGGLAKIPSDGVPYPIFVFSGLLFWNYFSTALTAASNSLITNENLIKKVYFPKLILPFSPAITPILDFLIAFGILGGMLIYYQFVPSWSEIYLLPLLMILSFMASTGLGTFLAAINVRYRDIRYALPFFIQSLLFLTPVIYPTTMIPEKYQWVIALNPMTGIIETARSIIIQTKPIDYQLLLISVISAILFFIIGIFFFRKTEKVVADIA